MTRMITGGVASRTICCRSICSVDIMLLLCMMSGRASTGAAIVEIPCNKPYQLGEIALRSSHGKVEQSQLHQERTLRCFVV